MSPARESGVVSSALLDSTEFDRVRAHLAAIVESAEDAIVSKTLNGIVTSWNAAAERLFGFSADEMIGQSILRIIPDELRHEEEAILGRLRAGERIERCETVRVHEDGRRLDISLTISPIRAADGGIVDAAKIAHDISARLRAERALEEEARALETLNRVGQALAAQLELDRVVQIATDAATELTGAACGAFFYNAQDEKGRSCRLFTRSGATRERFEHLPMPRATEIFAPTFHGEGAVRSDDIRKDPRFGRNPPYSGTPPGHLPVCSCRAVPVVSRAGAVIGGLFFGHPEPGVFTERAGRSEAERLSRIIFGKIHREVQPLYLHEVIGNAIDTVRQSAAAKRIRIHSLLETNIGLVRADPNRLQQALRNLLSNAVKFTPTGGKIQVVLERVNSHGEITIEDSGIGIRPDFPSYVFDRFRQSDATTTRRCGGLGLGLSIVKCPWSCTGARGA